jgi:hypothetical protein
MKVSIQPLQLEKTIQIIFDFINRYYSDLFIFLKSNNPELYKVLLENQNKKNLKALIKLYKFIRDMPYKKTKKEPLYQCHQYNQYYY